MLWMIWKGAILAKMTAEKSRLIVSDINLSSLQSQLALAAHKHIISDY